jgi:DNA-binding transcriptional MerR regulator
MEETQLSKKGRYNLGVVVQETGIKPDALRVWEKRYNLPQPQRSEGGHRLYSDYDIQVIKWLKDRQDEGMRIGQAANYWRELESNDIDPLLEYPVEVSEQSQTRSITGTNQTIQELRENWINACLDYDEVKAEQILTQAFAQFPLEFVCIELISLGLNTIGDYWYQGKASVQQEHFASELALKKIQALLSSAPRPIHDKMFLISCPAGEYHTLPILILNLLLRYSGWETLYLGANVPTDRLSLTIKETKPDLAVLSATTLPAAAALLDSVKVLADHNIPSAFSGKIFTDIAGLAELVPAHFINGDLSESVSHLTNLINNPTLPVSVPIPSSNGRKELFLKSRYQIDQSVMDHFDQKNENGLINDIRDANEFLFQGIMAALSFGNLNFMDHDLIWLYGLLEQRNTQKDLINEYLEQYKMAVASVMGAEGLPISNWIKSIIPSNPQ